MKHIKLFEDLSYSEPEYELQDETTLDHEMFIEKTKEKLQDPKLTKDEFFRITDDMSDYAYEHKDVKTVEPYKTMWINDLIKVWMNTKEKLKIED